VGLSVTTKFRGFLPLNQCFGNLLAQDREFAMSRELKGDTPMKRSKLLIQGLLSLAFVVGFGGATNSVGLSPAMGQTPEVNRIPNGQKVEKFRGVVSKRDGDTFMMGPTTGGPQTVVLLTSDTEVKSHRRGVFRGQKEYGQTYILRGLRLEVDGTGNADGAIVADDIRFDEQDLRTAQALKSTLDPMEAEMRAKLQQQQAEQEKLAGQIAETQAIATEATEAAKKAQQTADYANNRINGLDDFDPIKTITVLFATGSATLGPKGKQTIDEAAAWVQAQPDRKGWVLAVIGFADSTGNTQRNRDLSERRANGVIYYLVTKHKLPLNRLVQPFGYGQLEPVAANTTAEGRAKNRRVEIRLMRNKGIAGKVGQSQ
jgi:outer membrane protein OmpA-like peptidoglycan-associated protein